MAKYMSTPEGKVKAKILSFLSRKPYFYYTPSQQALGQTGIPDIMVCINGLTLGIECKSSGKSKPTVRQALQLERLHNAKGLAWVVDIDNVDDAIALIEAHEDNLKECAPSESFYRWRAVLKPTGFNNGYTC